MSSHHVVHAPRRDSADAVPLDRATHARAARTALGWTTPLDAPAGELAEVGLLLAGAIRVVADDVRLHSGRLPEGDGRRVFAELILREAGRLPSLPCTRLSQVHGRARMLRALYERLDRVRQASPVHEAAALP
ncbi:restriction endonuclease [Streptomyces sp. NPDC098077]|uniref:restriction endonuclease n=1 Tax=Streptomyces TaxID=1883 RepID=UPI0034340E53|nr:DUF6415 family natural product biosynthesis protein [Streptomyces anulatus]WST90409.1 DUF6415 family natural product biosynthesis protein [Streptomyces anulatus]WSW87795.1 DUF6415 family natural product biosynthesis protein [Streptomyces anulatus]